MKWFYKKKGFLSGLQSVRDVAEGDVFVKNDKVPSTFIVDRLLDFSPAPTHVRLKEIGGNERSITVALDVLMDDHFWHRGQK